MLDGVHFVIFLHLLGIDTYTTYNIPLNSIEIAKAISNFVHFFVCFFAFNLYYMWNNLSTHSSLYNKLHSKSMLMQYAHCNILDIVWCERHAIAMPCRLCLYIVYSKCLYFYPYNIKYFIHMCWVCSMPHRIQANGVK